MFFELTIFKELMHFAAVGVRVYVLISHNPRILGGSNYDSLIVRTVAFPVQVAYWIKRS